MKINYNEIYAFEVRVKKHVHGFSIVGGRASQDKNPVLRVAFKYSSNEVAKINDARKDTVTPIMQEAKDKGFLEFEWFDTVTDENVTQLVNPNHRNFIQSRQSLLKQQASI